MGVGSILLGAAAILAFLVSVLDRQLRANRRPEVYEDALGRMPDYWSDPDLFTEHGNRLRILLWVVVALEVAVLVLLVMTSAV